MTAEQTSYRLVSEYKVSKIRECQVESRAIDTPAKAYQFWADHVTKAAWFRDSAECMVVMFLNTRRNITGFSMVSIGTLDTLLVHPREVFRAAIVQAADAIVIMHNHPSGDPTPSEADIKVTRDLIRAGQLLKIEVLDHVIAGEVATDRPSGYCSLRELGYFYS